MTAKSRTRLSLATCAALACASATSGAGAPRQSPAGTISSETFFDLQRVWSIHLTFAPEQWAAMEPKGGSGSAAPPRAGGGPPGPAPQRPFGPATFNVPLFMGQGDADRDGRLSHDEFVALGRAWYAAWDTDHVGRLTRETLRRGINRTMVLGGGAG
jgi:spore coat protein H